MALAALLSGCDLSMTQQNKYDTYSPGDLWADGTSARPLPAHVGAQGDLARDAAEQQPAAGDAALLARGRERFDIYCSPCHGLGGDGDGMIVRARLSGAAVLSLEPRLLAAPASHFYDVITQRLWRHVFLRRPRRAARPLGDHRLYPRVAVVSGTPLSRWPRKRSGSCHDEKAAGSRRSVTAFAAVGLIFTALMLARDDNPSEAEAAMRKRLWILPVIGALAMAALVVIAVFALRQVAAGWLLGLHLHSRLSAR